MFFLRRIKVVTSLLAAAILFGCQTQSTSSSSSESESESGSSGESSSSGGASGSSSSMPSGGSYNPFPQSGSNEGQKGAQNGRDGKGGSDAASAESGGQSGGGENAEDRTLSEALEEFERARNRGGDDQGSDRQAQSAAVEESDFPILLPPSGNASEGEQREQAGAGTGDAAEGTEAGGGAQTGAEKVAVLDRQLEDSYGQFEGMILRERGYVRDRDNAKGSDVDVSEGDAGSGAGSGGDEPPLGPITGSGSGTRPEGGDQREGDYQHTAQTFPPPGDIPDGSDDDVVARQLREAAMKEPDPELREKLWEEYRKYKSKSSGK